MKNSSWFLFIVLLLLSNSLSAQQHEGQSVKRIGLTLTSPEIGYKNEFSSQYSDSSFVKFQSKHWSGLGFSFTNQYNSGNIFSVGVWGLTHSKGNIGHYLYQDTMGNSHINNFDYNVFESNFSIEYKFLLRNKKSRASEFLGIGLYPTIGSIKFNDIALSSYKEYFFYPVSSFYMNFNLALLPTFKYQISERLSLELSAPVNFASISFETVKVDDFSSQSKHLTNSTISFDLDISPLRPYIGIYVSI